MKFQLEIYLLRRRIQQSLVAEKRMRQTLKNHRSDPEWMQDNIDAAVEVRGILKTKLDNLGFKFEEVYIRNYTNGLNNESVKRWRDANPDHKRMAVMRHMDRTKQIFEDGTNGRRPA
ncbi:hypothetical protein VPHD520_0075 [Vibrio phage D520]